MQRGEHGLMPNVDLEELVESQPVESDEDRRATNGKEDRFSLESLARLHRIQLFRLLLAENHPKVYAAIKAEISDLSSNWQG